MTHPTAAATAADAAGPLPLPLAGLRVLDATHIVAGPFCSLILADMGAEVIKVERPGRGDLARGRGPFIAAANADAAAASSADNAAANGGQSPPQVSARYLGVNRNKKSVALDLRHPRAKAAFEQMVQASDVLLDNWGPGALTRLGLGYDRLRELNPGLIYASITGYGDSPDLQGPYSQWPANNLAIQAMAGWMEQTGAPDGPPQSVGDNIGDSIPGVWTALGIVLALETRRQTGQGQWVDMAMYECMAAHLVSNMNVYQATGRSIGRDVERTATAGLTLRAADGYAVLAGARLPERWRALWQLVGRPDLAQDARYLAPADGEFIAAQVIPAIEEWSARRPKWEVAGKLTELGFSMGVAQTIADLAHCPHLESRQMYVDTADTLGGQFRSLRTPLRLTGCAAAPAAAPPTLGQHNREILCNLGGLTEQELADLEKEGAV